MWNRPKQRQTVQRKATRLHAAWCRPKQNDPLWPPSELKKQHFLVEPPTLNDTLTQSGEMFCCLSCRYVGVCSTQWAFIGGNSVPPHHSEKLQVPLLVQWRTDVLHRILLKTKHALPRVDLEPACTQSSRKHTSVLKSRIDCSWLWTKVDAVRSALVLIAKTWWVYIKPLVAVISVHVLALVSPLLIGVALISHMIISQSAWS